jgi:hypothetical protein
VSTSRGTDGTAHGRLCQFNGGDVQPSAVVGRVVHLLQPARMRWRRATAQFRVLPDFVIVGAQKAGTTSLYAYLRAHPRVLPAASKEVHFFDTCAWDAGPETYRANFPMRAHMRLARRLRGAEVITGEATPYYLYHPLAPERLAATAPDTKIIILLRDPVERTLSHYWHEVRGKRETLPVREALEAEGDRLRGREAALVAGQPPCQHLDHRNFSYRARSRYSQQVAKYLRLFPAEHVLVLQSEKLFSDDPEVKQRLAEFLGLPPLSRPFVAENVGSRSPRNAEEAAVRDMLVRDLAEDEDRLRDILGEDFRWRTGVGADTTGA